MVEEKGQNTATTKETLILGAGPAGMAAAFELDKAGKNFYVLEKTDSVGGLSKTFRFGDYITDVGPHRFFSQNRYLYQLIEDLLGERWIKVNRLTRFYINNKFFMYPIEIRNALANVGPALACRIVADYSYERIKEKVAPREKKSFEDHTVSDFGRSLANLNMLNYTEKVWGLPCSRISTDWAKQRIKGLSFLAVVKNAIKKSNKGPKTLVDQFYYPEMGTGTIYEGMKNRIEENRNGEILLRSRPVRIRHDGKRISEVEIETPEGKKSACPKNVLSSIPITTLLELLDPLPPKEVMDAAKKLLFRSHTSLFITLDRPTVFPDQWVYFPNLEIPFGRIMEPRNFSAKLSPEGKTSLLVEFFCWENDRIWNASKEELLKETLDALEPRGFIKKSEVGEVYVHREKYAYPVYDIDYKESLEPVLSYLRGFENLQLIGRAGAFRYNNQDHALEMGILAARGIIEGKKYDLENVGAEQEYFERGYIK